MKKANNYIAGLYCRLSKDDEQNGESISIGTQKSILSEYCRVHDIAVYKIYVDDGYSGLNFERPGFQELLQDVEDGNINMVLTKDLSRLGRDYIMTGYYSEIFFRAKGVRYIALNDDFDSGKDTNDIAPFKNILNDMYAKDISRKVKHAKQHRAKQGLFIGSQTPYGYKQDSGNRNRLIIDMEAADVVRTIYAYAESGMGNIAIAHRMEEEKIFAPAAYKYHNGDTRFARYPAVQKGDYFKWCPATIGQILSNPVYTGTLVSLKTETDHYKTKRRITVPPENRVITYHAHDAIITQAQFEAVKEVRSKHSCPANIRRENIFRGLLFCECCGHPLQITTKQLLYSREDIYFCQHHFQNPEECPRTHRIYHNMLYTFVLQQIQVFAKSMRRRKVNSKIAAYAEITELTPEILKESISRIEISHVKKKSKPGSVIQIYWKLR